ncbi:MAG: hypothetical protein P8Y25_07565 [Chromatiaceae bacterium]
MFRKLILASAVSLALVPASASALGLGAIRTHSALYEPFVGEIALRDVKPNELDNIKVGLAPDAEFKKVGASYSPALGELKFKPQISPQGRPIIRVTSEKPIREPYLDFLLEVRSAQGRLVKEYTVLLDLPSTVKRHRPRIAEAVAEPVYPTTAETQATPAPKEAPVRSVASITARLVFHCITARFRGAKVSGRHHWRLAHPAPRSPRRRWRSIEAIKAPLFAVISTG